MKTLFNPFMTLGRTMCNKKAMQFIFFNLIDPLFKLGFFVAINYLVACCLTFVFHMGLDLSARFYAASSEAHYQAAMPFVHELEKYRSDLLFGEFWTLFAASLALSMFIALIIFIKRECHA